MEDQDITGIVLAGGQGSRMGGQDKGWVKYNGKPMIESVIARLAPQVTDIIISANRNLDAYKALGYSVVTDCHANDRHTYEGPIAGILSCLRAVKTEYAVVVPCDAPLIGANLVNQLKSAATQSKKALILFEAEGRLQPLFGLYHRSLVNNLAQYFAAGERKLVRWCEQQSPEILAFSGSSTEFANINTPEELKRLESS